MCITVENGKFYTRESARIKMPLKPYAKDKFVFDNTAIIGEFKRDASDKITGLFLANKRGVSASLLRKTDKPLPARP